MHTEIKQSWAARLWEEKESREHSFAAVIFPHTPDGVIGFGVGSMAHRALDAACMDIGFRPIYDRGFSWPENYSYDEAVQRDCLRSENEQGDVVLIYKL